MPECTTDSLGGNTVTQSWDLLIRGAKVFDGSGALPSIQDVSVRTGKIAARGDSLPADAAAEVVDGSNQWLVPGMLDIHTHLDLVVDVAAVAIVALVAQPVRRAGRVEALRLRARARCDAQACGRVEVECVQGPYGGAASAEEGKGGEPQPRGGRTLG